MFTLRGGSARVNRKTLRGPYTCVLALTATSLSLLFYAPPQERQAAARAYASCLCVQRASSDPFAPSLTPKSLGDMAALSSALLPTLTPTLTWGGDGSVAGLHIGGGGDDGEGGEEEGEEGDGYPGVEALLEGVLSKVWGGGWGGVEWGGVGWSGVGWGGVRWGEVMAVQEITLRCRD